IGAPGAAVDDVVYALMTEAIQHDLWRAVGFVVLVFVGDEEEVGRGDDPYAAEADFETGNVIELVVEDGAFVEMAVAVGIFEYDDAVGFAVWRPFGIGEIFSDPDAAFVVEGEADGLD